MRQFILLLHLLLFILTGYLFSDTTFVEGVISGTWETWGSPYLVIDSVYIPAGEELVIQPGSQVVFRGHHKLIVNYDAILKAIGTEFDSICFTAEDSSEGHGGLRFIFSSEACSLVYCRIEHGKARGGAMAMHGGGIYCDHASPTISHCTITRCTAEGQGGGISCDYPCRPIISYNLICNNYATRGGGLCCFQAHPEVCGNIIANNGAEIYGGGIFHLWSEIKIENNIISGNKAAYGGGVAAAFTEAGIVNNTITANSAEKGGGFYALNRSTLTLLNNIFWEDSASEGKEVYLQYETVGSPYPCTVFVAHNLLGAGSCFTEDGSAIIWGTGNIGEDPLFSDSVFHLGEGSPCLDAGTGNFYVALWDTTVYAPVLDFEGDTRPSHGGWDLGADESPYNEMEEAREATPVEFNIYAYPNPFNLVCRITVVSSELIVASLEIFTVDGRLVDWWTGKLPGGMDKHGAPGYSWEPSTALPSGVYLIRAIIGSQSTSIKVLYLK